jgi:hypothetical protein
MKLKTMMAVVACALAIGTTAHAQLGWTLNQCQNAWGNPIYTEHNAERDLQLYVFNLNPNMTGKVYLLHDHVQSIGYLSMDRKFLRDNAQRLLRQSIAGAWKPFNDGRRKETTGTWQCGNPNDDDTAGYAILWADPDVDGTYMLEISTGLWLAYMRNQRVN